MMMHVTTDHAISIPRFLVQNFTSLEENEVGGKVTFNYIAEQCTLLVYVDYNYYDGIIWRANALAAQPTTERGGKSRDMEVRGGVRY